MKSSKLGKIQRFLISSLILVFVIMVHVGPYYELQNIVLLGLYPLILLVTISRDLGSSIFRIKELSLFFLFLLLCSIGVFFTNFDYPIFLSTFPQLIYAFLASYIVVGLSNTGEYTKYFHLGYIISIILLIYIEWSLGNFSLIGFTNPSIRRDVFAYNANFYGYISVYANFSLFFLHLKYRSIPTLISLIFLPISFVVVAFITQSRGALILLVLSNLIFWFWVYSGLVKTKYQRLVKLFSILIVATIVISQLFEVYRESSLKERFEQGERGGRDILLNQSIDVFLDNPFLGVGYGQFPKYNSLGLFSHNSFTEALAEHGVFIGMIIILIFCSPLIKSTKFFVSNRGDSRIRLCILFFGMFLIFNNIYVHYKASYSMMYFFLIVNELNLIRRGFYRISNPHSSTKLEK